MAEKDWRGPLHLQRYLASCTDAMADVVRSAVGHPVSLVSSLQCQCAPTVILPKSRKSESRPPSVRAKDDAVQKRTAEVRRRNLESTRVMPAQPPAGNALPQGTEERRQACRFFELQMNDEDGIVHAYCRRCERMILVYDRALYWGVKRETGVVPPTYPYLCSCGSHTFEMAIGLHYQDDALDENDLEMITVAVRCASCNEIALVFDDEAT
ncbi:MAG: hypothetical protein NTW87_06585 [Planctomycetota bacterium]|nr:hypothetical protein [Planctomycetota bacterium]